MDICGILRCAKGKWNEKKTPRFSDPSAALLDLVGYPPPDLSGGYRSSGVGSVPDKGESGDRSGVLRPEARSPERARIMRAVFVKLHLVKRLGMLNTNALNPAAAECRRSAPRSPIPPGPVTNGQYGYTSGNAWVETPQYDNFRKKRVCGYCHREQSRSWDHLE